MAKQSLLRPLLGPLDDSGDNPMPMLVYDMYDAICSKDTKQIRRVMKLGAGLAYDRICMWLDGESSPEMMDAVISTQRYDATDLGLILKDALAHRFWNIVGYLLDESQVDPDISYEVLSECMKQCHRPQALDVFKKLLQRAGEKMKIVAKPGMARRMAEHRGEAWLEAWDKYEAGFKKGKEKK